MLVWPTDNLPDDLIPLYRKKNPKERKKKNQRVKTYLNSKNLPKQ